ncbi:diguanylate kinase signaling protein [Clostridioides difficile]|uniref:tetratricopeptide repeat-containing diguanylate cyclase n=1 Tax=Clostridioides difficile TaxID=1496 RepID=UPI000D1DA5C3|nr:tetratricopeptide repeat-containing diguanylate cyclase [Clostridioides difficile]UWD39884.1 diguanylate cyclase [Clostridioides difficile]UWD43668.1 diguanylate cyclase [Clostridioides difficile]VFC52292.1 diguanylate kinase signaling protein [Clostridioides difficile]VFF91444.1 diguanylate kinase signaling protein [Clostridioides difficile]VHX71251.1 diguanylate kinase signaling protein [Clostridioides difficile]
MNFRLPKKRLPKKIIFICIILISIVLFIKYDQNGLKEREIISKGKYMSESLVADKSYDEAKKVVKTSFESIPAKKYNKVYNEVWDMLKTISYVPDGTKIVIDSLEKMRESDAKLSDECRFNIEKRLASVYIMDNNYSKAVDLTVKSIKLAEKLGNNYEKARLDVDLASILLKVGSYKTGEKLIKDSFKIDIDEGEKNGMVRLYALINLAEIYVEVGEYDKAIEISSRVKDYKKFVSTDNYNDFEIMASIMQANAYIEKNNIQEAKNLLEKADYIIKSDRTVHILDKDMYYYMAMGNLEYKNENYDSAIDNYKKSLDISTKRKLTQEKIKNLNKILNIYEKQGNVESLNEYQKMLINEYKENKSIRDSETSFYIIDKVSNESELFEKTKKEIKYYKILFTVILIAVLGSTFLYNRLKYFKAQNLHDGLTNVYNRKSFDIMYEKYRAKDDNFALVMIDIDNFKLINDNYGHKFGDVVIKGITNTICVMLEQDDKVFRYGGEEFSVLIRNKSGEEVADIVDNIRVAIANKKWNEDVTVTISAGVAHISDSKDVLEEADKNLYKAKQLGRNKVVYK